MFLLALLAGCFNTCQQLCQTMGDRALECDLHVTDEDVKACQDAYDTADDATLNACAEAGDKDQLKEWWTCEEVAENFQKGAAAK